MCFSAKASFIAAGALSTIGLLSIRKTHTKKLIPFASTPLFFALQQACEGIAWLSITKIIPYSFLYTLSVYSFVFFAGVWWPLWVPSVLLLVEHNSTRKKLLLTCLIMGIVTAAFYATRLVAYPVQVFVVDHHIFYPILSYHYESLVPIMYIIATLVPFFATSIRYTWILGSILAVACVISQVWFIPATASVWCFFAAVASLLIYFLAKNN